MMRAIRKGDAELVAKLLRDHVTSGEATMLAQLGHAHAAANHLKQAQDILGQLNALSKDKYVSSYLVGTGEPFQVN